MRNKSNIMTQYFLLLACTVFFTASTSIAALSISIPGPLEIVHCDFSSNNGVVWALAMDFNPSKKGQESSYSILKLKQDNSLVQYKIPIPVGDIVTPYRAKNQVRFFRLINNRYLYVGTMQLDGTIYFVKFDTKHPEDKHETMKMRLKGDADASNIFVADDGSLRFVGSENGLPYVVALGANKKTIFEKKGLGLPDAGKLKFSELLNNGNILLVLNTYQNDTTGTAFLALISNKGNVIEKKKIQGLVVEAKPAGNDSVIILIAHDQGGKDMEAQSLDSQLNVTARYPVPEYFKLIDAAGKLMAVNSTTLLSIQVDRTPGSQSLAHLKTYSDSGTQSIGQITNPAPGDLRAYNISAQLIDRTLYVGTAVTGISNKNEGQKTFQVQTFTVH